MLFPIPQMVQWEWVSCSMFQLRRRLHGGKLIQNTGSFSWWTLYTHHT